MYLAYVLESQNRGRVVAQHTSAASVLVERHSVVEVSSIPEPEDYMTKVPVLYVDPETGTLWYEYQPQTSIEELQARIIDLELALAALLGQ
jgi:hypothetical protein